MKIKVCGIELELQQRKVRLVEDLAFGIDYYWIDLRDIYAQRQGTKARGAGHWAITEIFWRLCSEAKTLDDDVRMSYLKARLLPEVRAEGSRKVFEDGRMGVFERRNRKKIAELNELLAAGSTVELAPLAFYDKTAGLLGNLALTPAERQLAIEVEEEVFAEASKQLFEDREQAFRSVCKKWNVLNARWGTRSSTPERKAALNVLSYECKADFHRCYSAAWEEVLKGLYLDRKIDESSCRWMSLWHTDVQLPLEGERAVLHLLHGHVFALHPGAALLLLTASGRKIAADWLMDLDNEHKFYKLLNALFVCMFQYQDEHETYKAARRRRPEFMDDVADAEAKNFIRKRGDGRDKPRKTDAR